MELISNAIQIVITIFLMMALGFVGGKRRWFGEDAKKLLTFLVVKIALPCMILSKITTSYTRDSLLEGAYGMVVPILSMLAAHLLAKLLIPLLRVPKGRRGTFTAMIVFSNSVFVGVPIATALFGEEVLPHTLLYYIANTLFFWTFGARELYADAHGSAPFFSKQSLKNLVNPPLMVFLLSVVIVLIGLSLPKAVLDACDYVGGVVTPLSMIFIGVVLSGIKLKGMKPEPSLIAVILGRFVLSPIFICLLAMVIPLPDLTLKSFLVQSSMPIMSQVSITAQMYGADAEYATLGTTVTTVLSMVALPVLTLML